MVFFFYFFGSGVSFVLDGAWLHEVPAPDNAGVVASWRQSRQLFNHAPKPMPEVFLGRKGTRCPCDIRFYFFRCYGGYALAAAPDNAGVAVGEGSEAAFW